MCFFTMTSVFLLVGVLVQTTISDQGPKGIQTPPRVEPVTMLLDSYIPASMQILAHLTELMKYDLRPTTTPPYGPTTTSTVRPTPSHRPGIFSPPKPPGAAAYFASIHKGISYREYLERLKQPSGSNYFARYKFNINDEEFSVDTPRHNQANNHQDNGNVPSADAYSYFGKSYTDLLRLASRVEPDEDVSNDIELQVLRFSKNYDDSNFSAELLRQKQVPPTKAYVSLLSLYDLLNKESKRLGFSKYQGYTDRILQELHESSSSTSAYQLRFVLSKIIERDDTKKPDIVQKIKKLIVDIDDLNSYMNLALRYIPPLAFVL